VTLLLPRGIIGTIRHWTSVRRERAAAATAAAPDAAAIADAARPAE
jgi:hypothetical protein